MNNRYTCTIVFLKETVLSANYPFDLSLIYKFDLFGNKLSFSIENLHISWL